jgi:DNA-binding IclR family transcriptional regulator
VAEPAGKTDDPLAAAALSRRHVYQLLTETPASFGDICDRSTYNRATVNRALNDLEFLGLIHQPHHGHYARAS